MDVTFAIKPHHRYIAIVDGRTVATAFVNDAGNYVQSLYVSRKHRRQGIALALVRFITEQRGRKLNRCPNQYKNDPVRALSATLGDELLEEAS
jgi:GNAT superfamily N-acetyltransferase